NAHLTIDIIDSSLADGDMAQLIDLKINEANETEFDVYYALIMVKKNTHLEYQT
uniref:Uncharacterized protein n=1 Tax=Amphimedon queenslandica TaxID=400682 RepID=A0A1X7T4G8_AMPQE